jgi:hypothetical protein
VWWLGLWHCDDGFMDMFFSLNTPSF